MAKKRSVPEVRFRGYEGEWEERKLGEIACFSKGHGYSKSDLCKTGIPIILYGRLYTNYKIVIESVDTYACGLPNSVYSTGIEVIVPASGESAEDIVRASAVKISGALLGGDLNIIKAIEEIDSIFLALSISNGEMQKELSKKAQGKSVVHLRNSDLKEVEFYYPNKTEQPRIGALFRNLDARITLEQRKYEKLQNIKKAMLEKMFPKPGATEPEVRFKGFGGKWEKKKLGDLSSKFQSGEFIKANDIAQNGPYPVFGGNGLRGYAHTYNHDGEFTLIGRQGALCGNVKYIFEQAYITEHAIAVSANSENNTIFLYYLFGIMNLGQYSGQSAQPGLAVGNLILLNTLVPNKTEQTRIGDFFRNLDSLITLQQRKCEKLQNIKKAMLGKMFV